MSGGFHITADVLVVGGGMAGAWAAIGARRAGASVVLVEKGWLGTSGVTAMAGPGHWRVAPANRQAAITRRIARSGGLNDAGWMMRILETTWNSLPDLCDEVDVLRYRALSGPEYMRALRHRLEAIGVCIVDHAAAQQLLRHGDGSVAGACGVRTSGGAAWQVDAGAVVLATGGTAFRSRLPGSWNNTGDGYLMAAEAGADLSGMEFTAVYSVAPARMTLTGALSFAFATYQDASGQVLPVGGPDVTRPLAQALLRGPVFADLSRTPGHMRSRVPAISPNFVLPFHRWGIDPYRQRFEVTLHGEGTIGGIGGIAVETEDCGTAVPGLFAAGDAATRERVTGAISGGDGINAAWALSSGLWSGAAAARIAARSPRRGGGRRLGRAGLAGWRRIDRAAILAQVQDAMLRYDKVLFREARVLRASLATLDTAWTAVCEAAPDPATRELAAMVAAARWTLTAALARGESRGIHQRSDFPAEDPALARRIRVRGLDPPVAEPEALQAEQPA